jgi:NADH-quinone oxidoreductase subunit H
MSIMTGSMQISEMTREVGDVLFDGGYNTLYLVPWLILFLVMIYSTLGALEFNPFSAAHAETEIVGGWNTELSGSDLAMTKLAEIINLFNLSGLIAAVYLGGPIIVAFSNTTIWADILAFILAIATFILKVGIVTFLLAFVATTSSRLRIDQITETLWMYFLPTSMIAIFFIIGIQAIGGQ